MALFFSAVDTLFSTPFPSSASSLGSTVAPLRCCQPKKLGASLGKVYSPECVEGEFSEVGSRLRRWHYGSRRKGTRKGGFSWPTPNRASRRLSPSSTRPSTRRSPPRP